MGLLYIYIIIFIELCNELIICSPKQMINFGSDSFKLNLDFGMPIADGELGSNSIFLEPWGSTILIFVVKKINGGLRTWIAVLVLLFCFCNFAILFLGFLENIIIF